MLLLLLLGSLVALGPARVGAQLVWTKVAMEGHIGPLPSPRSQFSAGFHAVGGAVVVFGGAATDGSDTVLGDTVRAWPTRSPLNSHTQVHVQVHFAAAAAAAACLVFRDVDPPTRYPPWQLVLVFFSSWALPSLLTPSAMPCHHAHIFL
jgi:hypothetical protein